MQRREPWLAGSIAAAAMMLAPNALAQKSEASFYRAYYLEHEAGDLEGALSLYETVAADKRADGELRERARTSAVALSEDLSASDFARLMPPDTIFYAEINRPGERLAALCDQLGLLGGGIGGDSGKPAISPLLFQSVLGMRGAAVGITAVDPASGEPNGVAILHPGDLDLARGLIETAVPGGGVRVDDIVGYPTWHLDGEVFVALTSRLAVASPDPAQVAGVLRRLSGKEKSSLAGSPGLRSAMESRGEDLVFFCLNAEPVMPMIQGLIQQEIGNDREAQMAVALLDVDSLRSVSGRLGVGAEGLGLDVALQLADDHTNLAFNLMRTPHVDERTFALVPEGAAFFLATAFNEPAQVAPAARGGEGQAVVTFMDFGRELFANLVDVAIYGVPTEGGGLPGIAAVVRVNDVERSRALWDLCLGVASQATGAQGPEHLTIAGADAERFIIEGVPVYLVTGEGELMISPNKAALEHTLNARRRGRTIAHDPLFAESVASIDEASCGAVLANAGRLAQMAAPFIPSHEREQVMQMAAILSETVFCLDAAQSSTRLAYHLRVHNVPDVSGLVEHALSTWKGVSPRRAEVSAASSSGSGYGGASEARGKLVASEPVRTVTPVMDDPEAIEKEFEKLVAHGEHAAARKVGERYVKAIHDDANLLNTFAWNLLTQEGPAGHYDELALVASKQSNALTQLENWMYVDTLALAVFQSGNVEKAVALERKAIELAGDDPRAGEAVAALKRFEKAAQKLVAKESKQAAKHGEKAEKPRGISEKESVEGEVSRGELEKALATLAKEGRHEQANAVGKKLMAAAKDDHFFLNNKAWTLLTEDPYAGRYGDLALAMAKRSNELTHHETWTYVDTLALAAFQTGHVEQAVELERKAVELAGDDSRAVEAKTALARFEAALAKSGAKQPRHGEKAASLSDDEIAELKDRFEELAAEHQYEAAAELVERLVVLDDADRLNVEAWTLLTEAPYQGHFAKSAAKLSQRSNELTDFGNWYYLDTLALAVFESGDTAKAIEIEKKAINAAGDDPRVGEAIANLERFQAALPGGAAKQKEKVAGHMSLSELREEFDVLATKKKQHAKALEVGQRYAELAHEDAKVLNNFAWALLTEGRYEDKYDDFAWKLSNRANELEGFSNWLFIDTLALAVFKRGDVEKAILLQRTALKLAGDDPQRGEAEITLERYEKALAKEKTTIGKK